MKRFQTSIPDGLMPVFKSDLQLLQNEAADAYTAHLLGLGEPVILSGCEVTVNSPSNITVSAGVVFLSGDCMRVNAYTGSFPCWLSEDTPITETKIFKDGSTQNVFTTRVTTMGTVYPGGSNNIYFDPYTSQYYRHVIKRQSHDVGELIPYIGSIVKGSYDLFDLSGNGKWEWKNFRIALKGKTMLGFNPSTSPTPASAPGVGIQNYGAIGNTGGADSIGLTADQNGLHAHDSNIKTDNVSITFDGGSSSAHALQHNAATPDTADSGLGQLHENRPAYYVTALLERY